jgi:TetR/AcrR family transcriptional repressor of nem operon
MTKREVARVRRRLAPEIRRAAILDAATRLILSRGVGGLTMEDVAREAGIAKGTVYLYFDSVGGLTAELRNRYAQTLLGEVGPLLSTGGSGSRFRRLDTFIAATAKVYEGGHELHHALFDKAGASEAPLVEAFRTLLRAFIEDGRAAGEFSVPDLDLTVGFLLAGLHAVLSEGLHGMPAGKAVATAQRLARRTLTP